MTGWPAGSRGAAGSRGGEPHDGGSRHALVTLLVLQVAPHGTPASAYPVWGWRIPFIAGAGPCAACLAWYSRAVPESPTWQAAEKPTWQAAEKPPHPVREVVAGRAKRDFLQVFVMMTGIWFISSMASGLLPAQLHAEGHVTPTEVTGALVIVQAIHSVLFPFIGALSERIGRRAFLAINGVAVAVLCSASFASLAAGWWSGFGVMLLVTLVIRLTGGSMFAVTLSYLCERFPAGLRGTGFGLGYSTPLLITSFYAYYQNWLGALMPGGYTPVVLLATGGILMLAGALMGPETRWAELSDRSAEPGRPGVPPGAVTGGLPPGAVAGGLPGTGPAASPPEQAG
ncbi:MAG TPA: MFS transporter [Streptosporangiaceae bacterium]|nr:MFS transporter [Streptosporangiaceae bacterium]